MEPGVVSTTTTTQYSIQRVGGGRWAIKTEPADVHYSTPENTWRNFLVYVCGGHLICVLFFSILVGNASSKPHCR